jgi:hypothetical protein
LLDGAVAWLSNYGWPSLPDGVRVYGHEPMRLLCHLLSLKPPTRRLTGERTVRSLAQLLEDLEKQRPRNRDELLKQARLAMAEDNRGVLDTVRSLFGDDAVGLSRMDNSVIPGRGAWGDARLSRAEQAQLEGRGISASEAVELRELLSRDDVFSLDTVAVMARGHAYGLNELRRWSGAGARIIEALELLDSGRSFEDAEAYLRAGCAARYINRFIDIGLTPERYAPFKALGIDEVDGARFAFAGISPETALAWKELGGSGWDAWAIISTGGNLADAQTVAAAGEDLERYAHKQFQKFHDDYPPVMWGGRHTFDWHWVTAPPGAYAL